MSDREAHDLAMAAARMMRALVRRAAAGDTLALEELARLEDLASVAVTAAGYTMHASRTQWPRSAYSWSDLGKCLGISRQAAFQRFGRERDSSLWADFAWLVDAIR